MSCAVVETANQERRQLLLFFEDTSTDLRLQFADSTEDRVFDEHRVETVFSTQKIAQK